MPFLALFAIISILAISGFVFAEAVRLGGVKLGARFVKGWNTKPGDSTSHFRLALIVGGAVYVINLLNWICETFAGVGLRTPTSGLDLMTAVLLYPLMCMMAWPMVLKAHEVWKPPAPPSQG